MAEQITNKVVTQPLLKKPLTAIKAEEFLGGSSLEPAGGVAGKIVGISLEDISATSTKARVLVQIAHDEARFQVPVIAGVPLQTMVDQTFDVSSTDSKGIDLTAQVKNQLKLTRIISPTLVEVKILK